MPLDVESLRGKLPIGGTILGTSRTSRSWTTTASIASGPPSPTLGIDAVIVIGGEGTLGAARDLAELGFPVVGVPKTIDNDMGGTEMTFGFQTAVQICTDAIDRLHTTAESHDRVMVVEVMGRHAGHIAVWSGIAGGATVTLIPEEPFDIDAVCDAILRRHESGTLRLDRRRRRGRACRRPARSRSPRPRSTCTATSASAASAPRIGGEIERRTGYETRVTILGHIQRGGTPNAYDRVLATRYGVAAIDLVHEGRYGEMVALQSDCITSIPLADAKQLGLKTVDPQLYDVARVFFALYAAPGILPR